MNSLELIRELVALPGPPGQETLVREAVAAHAARLRCAFDTDARGNLLLSLPGAERLPERPDIVVMAHLDEIALMVVRVEGDGRLVVTNLGGVFPWKWGEGPVQILASGEALTGILSFGGIHTNDPASVAAQARGTGVNLGGYAGFYGTVGGYSGRARGAGRDARGDASVQARRDGDGGFCGRALSG